MIKTKRKDVNEPLCIYCPNVTCISQPAHTTDKRIEPYDNAF